MKTLCHLCGSLISGSHRIGGIIELENQGGFFLCSSCCSLPYNPFDKSYRRIGKITVCIKGGY